MSIMRDTSLNLQARRVLRWSGIKEGSKLKSKMEILIGKLLVSVNQTTYSPHRFDSLMERLKAYFSGCRTSFPDKLDLSRATHFQREVWEITRLIPYGETRSYAWVAEQIKKPKAVRAVGQALARNPLPIIIPCHRVRASDGDLGGFSGGIEVKRYLLSLEASANVSLRDGSTFSPAPSSRRGHGCPKPTQERPPQTGTGKFGETRNLQ